MDTTNMDTHMDATGRQAAGGTPDAGGTSVVDPPGAESLNPDSAIAEAFTPLTAGAATPTGKFIDAFA